jgi:hypothetical protein
MSPILISLLRTFVPWLVGLVGPTLTASLGWTPDDVSRTVTLVVAGVYYLAARLLEQYAGPEWGWLLGAPVQPTYGGRHAAGHRDTGQARAVLLIGAAVLVLLAGSLAPAAARGRPRPPVEVPEITAGWAGCDKTRPRTMLWIRVIAPNAGGTEWDIWAGADTAVRLQAWVGSRWVDVPSTSPTEGSRLAGGHFRWRPYLASGGRRIAGPPWVLSGEECQSVVDLEPLGSVA